MNKYRSHYGGKLSKKEIDKKVTISGWVANVRDHGGVIFLDIRDYYGNIQIVSNDNQIFTGITKETCVCVIGLVRLRNKADINPKIPTGEIEILVDQIEILGKAPNALPFEIITSQNSNEETRLKYRYLDLRNPSIKENILFRSKVIQFIRELMTKAEFIEIQTPILTASSPEGARDFIIPARRHHGLFYCLPQAPQQFKQLLMISGFDKYFQIAPCFRDEVARSDRIYGEFYQLDFEMAFAEEADVLKIGEHIFYEIFKKFSEKKVDQAPFLKISYKQAMAKYGTDKPDLRNPLTIIELTGIFNETSFQPFCHTKIQGIVVSGIADKPNAWANASC